MRSPKLDAYTFTPVIGACSALCDKLRGKQVHALFIKICSSDTQTIVNTALIDMYFKCNCLSSSVKVFDEMQLKDTVTWNTMISRLIQNGKARYAISVFERMRDEEKIAECFSVFTLCSVIKACALLKALRQGKQVHAVVIVMGRDLLVLSTVLIDLYASCALMEESMKVFFSLNCRKDDAVYNALLSGCVQNRKYEESFSILSEIKPNVIALTNGLMVCSMFTDLFRGKQIHGVAIRFGFKSDTQLCNVLLDMYAKCGKVVTARLLFNQIAHKTVVSWTSMMDAYGSHGYGVEAHDLFKLMEESGISPNSVTFLAVLSACGHSGLVELGRDCFLSMRKKYGIDPGPEHYACYIDLLGRAGLIEEVWDLFDDMEKNGHMPTAAVLASLLNACKLNLDIERGEFAAKRLIELEPDKACNFVSLSNFYAATERWDQVVALRNLMKKKSLRKETGGSWIAIE
ncbi:Pentatricopeptide repeat-containing protein [Thalictrum thalictroides]|uniref:Pentatricopeptide repeat-containing protein n=1 Tax=Thalictrum thalictroides TaxID=46969 RepID=A0A7J6WIL8_THATH|nr:Pentatricopeptide repeat-containing protein [Thalictrum thalictroides]